MILQQLAKRNDEWIKVAFSICRDEHMAKEMVQIMYFRMLKYVSDTSRIMIDGKINKIYIYVTLRNIFYKMKNDKKKITKYEFKEFDTFDDSFDTTKYNTDLTYSYEDQIDANKMEQANEKIMKMIEDEIETWHWYDKKLFRLYYYTDYSLRDIAKKTNISLTSIFNSCKNYKQIIAEKFGEDITDFFNKDYDKI
jgi:RNA polymerase sigma factor (sigma-70 family)